MRIFVDTNVWVYRFDDDEPVKQAQIRRVLTQVDRDDHLVVSTQVLQEFYVTVTRKLVRPLSVDDALTAVRELSDFEVVTLDPEMIAAAIGTSRDRQLSLWDSLILHAAARAGCEVVYTEDLQHGFEVLGLRVVNPLS